MQIEGKNLRVSIVIPVYNEAAHLRACLDAVAAQTVRPYEVIVVDNNSSDGTAAVTAEYGFVRLLHEPRQGVVYAREHGFNAARGDIIGRIDADTLVATDWVATLQRVFATESVDVISGSARYHDMALSSVLNVCDLWIRRYLARMLRHVLAVQGANMALRRSVWRAVRHDLCQGGGLHEDFDIGIHASRHGFRLKFDKRLNVSLGFRQTESGFRDFRTYFLLIPRTYGLHGLHSRRYLYPVALLVIACYWPLKVLHRGYDPLFKQFSWQRLLTQSAQVRVNPGTFVD